MSNEQNLCKQYAKLRVDEMTTDELRKFVCDELTAFYEDNPDLLRLQMKNRGLTPNDLDARVGV